MFPLEKGGARRAGDLCYLPMEFTRRGRRSATPTDMISYALQQTPPASPPPLIRGVQFLC